MKRVSYWILHVPHTLRALVRADAIWLTVVAALVGCASGLSVAAMDRATCFVRRLLFGLSAHEPLSIRADVSAHRVILALVLGGAAVGLLNAIFRRRYPRRAVDPIEANALYGGRVSWFDSLIITLQSMLSNSVGAPVGLEAGYMQFNSALASRLGRTFRLRRVDMRVLTSCGAAGAIAATFNAPMSGAFYAFELLVGTYSLNSLVPVVVSAITAVSVIRYLVPDQLGLAVAVLPAVEASIYPPALFLGLTCALLGIAIMRGVIHTEEIIQRSRMPDWVRPAIGGVAITPLILFSPLALATRTMSLQSALAPSEAASQVVFWILLGAGATIISLGSGFRGGLLFPSLVLGALVGNVYATILSWAGLQDAPAVYGVASMSGLASAVVGAPLTATFLALELTGSVPLTTVAMACSIISVVIVRRTFGNFFPTWRFHQRGRAVDIGWMHNLTVGRVMRREMHTMHLDTTIDDFRKDVPLGTVDRVLVTDDADRYAGVVIVAEAHASNAKAKRLSDLLRATNAMLLPQMLIGEALLLFEEAEVEALAVVDDPDHRRVIGVLTELYALRRYNEELERVRRDSSV